jgi:tetratricopeptide (TPR) repeat protein/DNA-binding MarR family transcriptional regulator
MPKKLLIARDRIILHLSKYSSRELRDYSSPQEITQEGIGRAIGIGRNNVPREVNKLIKEGLVTFKKVRVNGFRNKRTVYFLTAGGIEEANRIKNSIKNLYITVVDFSGERRSLMLKDITKEIGIDFITAALNLTKDKILDLSELLNNRNPAVHIIDLDMKIKNFYGRRNELLRLKEWLNSRKKIFIITGISGIGKTTLVNKFVKEYMRDRNLIWIQIDDWITNIDLVMKLANFFRKLGKYDLERYLKSSLMGFEKELRWENIYYLLKKSLRNEVLIFDGMEHAKPEVKGLITRIISMVNDITEFRIILIGTEISRVVPPNKMVLTETLALGDLPRREALELLTDNGLSLSEAEKIYEKYGGNPIVLELIAKNGNGIMVKKYFVENVIYDLSEEERKAVEIASIFRKTLKMDILLLNDIDYTTIYSLVNKNILKEVGEDEFLLHKMIKEFIYRNIPSTKKRDYHRFVARYLEGEGQFLEAVYHYTQADEVLIANRILTENYKRYLVKDGVEAVRHLAIDLLNKYDDSIDDHEWQLYGIIGDTYEISGDWDMALENYLKARDLSKNRDVDFYAYSIIKIAEMYSKKGEYEKALQEIKECMKYYNRIRNLMTLSRLNYVYGMIALYGGMMEEAKSRLEEAFKIAERIMDYETLGYAYNGLGIYYRHINNYEEALESFNKSRRYFEAARDMRGLSKVLSNIGLVYYDNRDDEAETYYKDALAIARKIGDLWGIGIVKYQLANYYTFKDRYELALRNIREAEKIMNSIGAKDVLPSIYMSYSYLYVAMGDGINAQKYIDKAIDLSIQLGNEFRAIKYAKQAVELLEPYEDIDTSKYLEIEKGEKKVVAIITKS